MNNNGNFLDLHKVTEECKSPLSRALCLKILNSFSTTLFINSIKFVDMAEAVLQHRGKLAQNGLHS